MKKKFIILLILLCATPVWANDLSLVMGKAIASISTICGKAKTALASWGGGGVPAGAGEVYVLLWNGDDCNDNGHRDAKLSTGTCSITGTLAANAEIINTDEASYYFKATAVNEYLMFASSSITGIDPDEIYIKMLVKLETNTAGGNSIFEFQTDADNRMNCTVNGSNGQITFFHSGNNVDSYNVGNDNSVEALQYGYWGVVELKYSTTNSVITLRVCSTAGADCTECSGSEPWDTTTDIGHGGFDDMTATPTNVAIGEDQQGSFTNNMRITYLEIRTYANAP